jgi:hypothetical protein
MNNTLEQGKTCSQPTDQRSGESDANRLVINLRLSVEEGRWLVTAINIALRLLEGLQLRGPQGQWFQIHGLAGLRRIASQLPGSLSGFYVSRHDFEDLDE